MSAPHEIDTSSVNESSPSSSHLLKRDEPVRKESRLQRVSS